MTTADKPGALRSFFTIRAPLIAWIVAVAFFMEALDGTVIVTAMPMMARSFGVETIDVGIGITAYLLAVGVVLPASGWIADRFGPRNVFASAIVVFTIASIICAMSNSLVTFAGARMLQGAAAGLMSPVGRLAVLRKTPKERTIEAIGLITWPGLIGPVIGPPVGGFIATYWSWHWIFLINVPLGVIGVVLVLRFISNERVAEHRPFDFAGFALVALTLTSVIFGMDRIGKPYTPTWLPVALFAVALAFGVLAYRHLRGARAPLLDLSGLRAPSFFTATVSGGGLTRLAMTATPFLAPLFFQLGFGMNAFLAGLLILPYFLGNLLMKVVTTPILRTFGFWRVLVSVGVLNAICIGAVALAPRPDSALVFAALSVLLFVTGLSRSMNMTALATLTFADVPQEGMTHANTLSAVSWQVTQAVGVALATLALQTAMWARGGTEPAAMDFRWALGLFALGCLLSAHVYSRLHRDTGAALTAKA